MITGTLFLLGTSMPTEFFPGIGANMLMLTALRASAILLIKSVNLDILTPLAGINSYNVIVLFEKENIYSNDKNLLVILQILASFAQEESNSISQSIRWSYKKNAKIGNPTRKVCYGYNKNIIRNNTKEHIWTINTNDSERVKIIFNYAKTNLPLKDIVINLNKYENENNSNYIWNKAKIKYILHNEAYIGNLITHKRIIPDYVSKKIIINNNLQERIMIINHHESIIDKKTFNIVNKKEIYK